LLSCWIIMMIVMYYWYDVINANKMIHNELVLLVCFSTVDDMNLLIWSNPIHYKKSNILITLLVYQYCTKFWKKITILEQIFIPVLCTILVYQYCDRQVQEIRKCSSRYSLTQQIVWNWNELVTGHQALTLCSFSFQIFYW
jgi:hypothetical protein